MAKYSVSYIYEIIDKYSATANKIKRSTDRMKDSAVKAGKSFKEMGAKMVRVGAVMSAAVSLPILLLGKNMIKAASDAEETRSKFATIFQSMGSDAEMVADTFAKSYGLAGTSSRQLLGDTSDMLTGFGFTAEEALNLSKKTNELAVDLASFTNFSGGAEGASAALTKALLGERESVKSLGIAILEEDVKKKVAMMRSQGMTFATKREAKAYATLQIAVDQSKNAIGDYARTKNNYANVQRRVSEGNKELMESFGKILLPAAAKVLVVIEGMQKSFQNLTPATKKIVLIVAAFVAVLGPLILAAGAIVLMLPVIAAGFAFMISPIALVTAGVMALVGAFSYLSIKSGGIWEAFAATGLGVVDVLTSAFLSMGAILLDVLLSPIKMAIRLIDSIPGININSSITDLDAFTKMANSANEKKSDAISDLLVRNPAAEGAANQNTLNGNINLTANGAKVDSASMETSAPGNVGMNIAGAGS